MMFGHGTFIYDPNEALAKHGTWDGVAKAIVDLDMTHAWIRVHTKDGLWRTQENTELLSALKAHGITVFAWGWCDGHSVDQDVDNVRNALSRFSPDGYVADIEHGVSGARWSKTRIKEFCSRVRELIPDKPFLVSSFGFLPYHEPELMKAADPYVDAFAPQVYWFWFPKQSMLNQPGAHGSYQDNNPVDYARLCLDVWTHVVTKPIVITGQAYWGEASGWTRTHAEQKLKEFVENFDAYDRIVGLNWWHFAGNKAMSADMASWISNAKLGTRLGGAGPVRPPHVAIAGGARSSAGVGVANQPISPQGSMLAAGDIAYVRADKLNLRTEPSDQPSTVIIALNIGQRLQIVGDSAVSGWKKVSVEIDDRVYEGHVFSKYIRPQEKPQVEALLKAAYAEWFRFQRGFGSEVAAPYYEYIGDMWQAIGVHNRDGRDTQHPWSAAFISWIIRKAGYDDFLYSPLHAEYIHQAIRRREMSLGGPFWGFRLEEQKPGLGDIVCQWRKTLDAQGGQILIDYDYAEDHDFFFGHTDIVVQVNDRSIRTIGGNTGQEFGHGGSVSMKTYRLNSDGYLEHENRLFAIMRNNFR